VTRGLNGRIPRAQDSLTQPAATLVEYHDMPERTRFDIFSSQGDGRRIMQDGSIKVMNKQIDDLIIAELSTGTADTGTATGAGVRLFAKARGILGQADVDIDEEENMFCAISPAAETLLLSVKEYTNADYVDIKPLVGPAVRMRRWMGCNFFVSNRLSGKNTTAEKLLMWHRNAIGFAYDKEGMEVVAGYDEMESLYYARTSMFMGAKLLQNGGVCVINHDYSGIIAS
jgi:hypothetical protein